MHLTNIFLSGKKARCRGTYGIRLHIWKIQKEANLNYSDGSKGLQHFERMEETPSGFLGGDDLFLELGGGYTIMLTTW